MRDAAGAAAVDEPTLRPGVTPALPYQCTFAPGVCGHGSAGSAVGWPVAIDGKDGNPTIHSAAAARGNTQFTAAHEAFEMGVAPAFGRTGTPRLDTTAYPPVQQHCLCSGR